VNPRAKSKFTIGDQDLDLAMFMAICRGRAEVVLGDDARVRINRCNEFRVRLAVSERRIYGVNTGFGRLADTVIPPSEQVQLQKNLVRSHAVGCGEPLSRQEARGMILLRAMSLSHGFSGARVEVVEQLLWLLEKGLHPWIPSRGSVGASGDLAPLSHLALVLMGEGHLLDAGGERIEAGGPDQRHSADEQHRPGLGGAGLQPAGARDPGGDPFPGSPRRKRPAFRESVPPSAPAP